MTLRGLGRLSWLVLLLPLTHAMATVQDWFLYFPERLPVEQALAGGRAAHLAPWPSAADFRAWMREPQGNARATAIVFHGNAGHALHRAWYAETLTCLGIRVILVEYPGYGHRTGAKGEAGFADDGAALLALARSRFGSPVIVVGESLGAGVAGSVVAREHPDAVLLITPWQNLADVAAHHYPWLPTRWLLRDRYDTAANLATFDGPVAIIAAERDAVIPPGFAHALFDGLTQRRKRMLVVPAAGHSDWQAGLDAAAWDKLIDFLVGSD